MPKIIVSLWHIPTLRHPLAIGRSQDQYDTDRLDRRLSLLEAALGTCQAKIDSSKVTGSKSFKAVFVAPEYFFSSHKVTDNDYDPLRFYPFNEKFKPRLEQRLHDLSRRFPDILIIPGTAYYWKNPYSRPPELANKLDKSSGQRTIARQPAEQVANYRLTKAGEEVGQVIEREKYYYGDAQINQGHPGFSGGGKRPSVPSMVQKQTHIQGAQAGGLYIVRNVAYVFLNGERKAKYDKQGDYSEAPSADTVYIPGSADGQVDVDGYKIAFEVCFDHCLGRLKKAGTTPHFHIVASACVNNFPDHMANRDGGYFLHASTDPDATRVLRNQGGTQVKDNNVKIPEETGGEGILYHWELELPPPGKAPRAGVLNLTNAAQ